MFFGIYSDVDISTDSGFIGGFSIQKNFLGSMIFSVVMIRALIITRYFVWLTLIAILGSVCLYFLNIFAIQEFSFDQKSSGFQIHEIPVYYFSVLLILSACILPEIALKYHRKTSHPNNVDILLERKKFPSPVVQE